MSDESPLILVHPASDPLRLPIESWSLAALGVMLVIAGAALVRKGQEPDDPGESFHPGSGPDWAVRIISSFLLLSAIVVARVGSPFELENPVSVLLVAFLWPVLAIVCFIWPSFWDRIDPFDTLARIFEPKEEPGEHQIPHDVGLAAGFALIWTWYLSVYTQPLRPESFGLFLGAYSIAMLAGSLAFGRKWWLRRAEAFGAFYRMLGEARRGAGRNAPRRAGVLLAVVIGGLLFGVLRLTPLWGDLNVSPQATLWSTLGLLACCAAVVGALEVASRFGSRTRAVVLTAAPFGAAVVLAVGLLRNRLLVGAQLLPRLLLDPLDSGLNPFGWGDALVDPNPLGTTGLVMSQIGILTLGAAAGAMIARRRTGTEANPVIGVMCALLTASVLLVAGVAFPG